MLDFHRIFVITAGARSWVAVGDEAPRPAQRPVYSG